jgi:hypothetical protein
MKLGELLHSYVLLQLTISVGLMCLLMEGEQLHYSIRLKEL